MRRALSNWTSPPIVKTETDAVVSRKKPSLPRPKKSPLVYIPFGLHAREPSIYVNSTIIALPPLLEGRVMRKLHKKGLVG
jgi:hypothetical protein